MSPVDAEAVPVHHDPLNDQLGRTDVHIHHPRSVLRKEGLNRGSVERDVVPRDRFNPHDLLVDVTDRVPVCEHLRVVQPHVLPDGESRRRHHRDRARLSVLVDRNGKECGRRPEPTPGRESNCAERSSRVRILDDRLAWNASDAHRLTFEVQHVRIHKVRPGRNVDHAAIGHAGQGVDEGRRVVSHSVADRAVVGLHVHLGPGVDAQRGSRFCRTARPCDVVGKPLRHPIKPNGRRRAERRNACRENPHYWQKKEKKLFHILIY